VPTSTFGFSSSTINSSLIPEAHQSHNLFFYTDGSPDAQQVCLTLEELGLAYYALPLSEAAPPWSPGEELAIPILLDKNPRLGLGSPMVSPRRPMGGGGAPNHTNNHEVFGGTHIMLYLCEKYSAQIYSGDMKHKSASLGWALFVCSNLSPCANEYLFCIRNHLYGPQLDHAKRRLLRTLATLELRLEEHRYLNGREFSIADLAAIPWISALDKTDRCWDDLALPKLTNLVGWYSSCRTRPAMSIGLRVGSNEMFGAYRSYSSPGRVAKISC